MKNKNNKILKRVGRHMHTHDDYRMELADEESNPRISVPKKPKKLKAIDKRSLSCLILSERRLDDRRVVFQSLLRALL